MPSQSTYNSNLFSSQISPENTPVFNPDSSGKEKDSETGYHYFGARYYNSDLSLWLSVDPMSDKYPSISPYNYCAWNPVKLVDPDGMAVIPTQKLKDNSSIYSILKVAGENSVFKKVMSRFYSNQSNVYVHLGQLMTNGAPAGRQNIARTEPAGYEKNPVGKYGIERIIINSDILDKSGNLSGDRTFVFGALLHEGLHAKMFDIGQSDNNFSNYPGYRDFIRERHEEGGHHNQMAAFNRNLLIQGMKEFDAQIGSSHTEEWYEAVSWTGLHGTTAWREFVDKHPDTAKMYLKIQNEEVYKLGN